MHIGREELWVADVRSRGDEQRERGRNRAHGLCRSFDPKIRSAVFAATPPSAQPLPVFAATLAVFVTTLTVFVTNVQIMKDKAGTEIKVGCRVTDRS